MLKHRTTKSSLPDAFTGQTIVAQLLILWLCTLPLIALIIAPIFGSQMALRLAVALLIVILALCWGFGVRDLVRRLRTRENQAETATGNHV